jgi:hypothetical protein
MDASNRQKANKIYLDAKGAIKKNILPRFSQHSRDILLKYLETKLQFSERTPPKEFTLDFGDTFSFENLSNGYLISAKDNLKHEITPQEMIEKIINLSETLDEVDPLDAVAACGNNRSSNAWDVFIPIESATASATPSEKAMLKKIGDGDMVFISDFSCSNIEQGTHNVEHEIGHALNFVFANSKLSTESLEIYKRIRTCASSVYPSIPNQVKSFNTQNGDSAFTEEDTADLFSIMANPHDKKVYSCAFLEPAKNGNTYTNLNFININDTHSTPLARILLETINKDLILPNSCKNLIEKEGSNLRLKKCI